MLSNVPDAAGLESRAAAGIATAVVDHTAFGKDREAFERALQAVLEQHRIELVCLAGFMRLLTPWFVGTGRGACSTSIRRCCPPSRACTRTSARSRPA